MKIVQSVVVFFISALAFSATAMAAESSQPAATGGAWLWWIAPLGSLLALGFAFMAHDEFAWVERRLDGSVDKDVASHSALYARGRVYAQRRMWAKAAAHWSKAAALSPGHPDYRLALASAYINLDLAQPGSLRQEYVRGRWYELSA